uniref:Uncharacterized protein n=1 Tax=Polytomella parva TaxID=51329 RepID=A0A7S0YCV8_9CHLO|mmetsp:Transcript_17964/g.32802  ORF Transcript_17964/g.32802 Transcript_17964/m.32802 type:complete len:347 (+) Transcript_17964:123-1163(+)|eukprot:CAMPEP_0175051704 /NCGR_PEP_ID=MMETSP0052_2-20121109/7956_1 /TAXON_ID=51329 ORGANISM="Polytomella parva, Strain SAG 63-3" /NCGR_SAMPLE_ID=MMETSP0052_2 /ASSEMBLY_ACC=CAM_ASM_000194 /LENGTH=346 /DNA_ID=CAMNT_0016316035 /DNA_START=124 /DNA_END=1164 /DNA_ORIENTATION=-
MPVSAAAAEGVSGALGSVLAMLATYPLKTIYTYQALAGKSDQNAAALTILDVIRKYKLSGLYIGIEPNLIESGVSSGVYFYLYSKIRHFIVQHLNSSDGSDSRNKSIGVLASLFVATAAGAGNQLVTLPFSVVATRMQAQVRIKNELLAKGNPMQARSTPTSFATVAKLVFGESGILGFWKGLLPSMILLANPAVQYMLYEQILGLFRKWKAQRLAKANAKESKSETPSAPVKLSPGEVFLASALAKIGATFVTYPLIVVKSRIQASGKDSKGRSVGTFDVLSQIWGKEGFAGFYAGLQAKLLQTALNAALMLMLKEQLHHGTVECLEKGIFTFFAEKARNLLCLV